MTPEGALEQVRALADRIERGGPSKGARLGADPAAVEHDFRQQHKGKRIVARELLAILASVDAPAPDEDPRADVSPAPPAALPE